MERSKLKNKMNKKITQRSKIKSNNIKINLDKLNMQQKELAKKCNITSPHLSEIINGRRKGITLSLAVKISRILKQPIEEIFKF